MVEKSFTFKLTESQNSLKSSDIINASGTIYFFCVGLSQFFLGGGGLFIYCLNYICRSSKSKNNTDLTYKE